jgi:hypothetical protein
MSAPKYGRPAIWIGHVDVLPRDPKNSVLDDATGAIVNVLALVTGRDEYEKRVADALAEVGYEVREATDVEPFDPAPHGEPVADELLEAAATLASGEVGDVAWGTFYSYPLSSESE